jgi:hypothetical protein
MEAAVKGGHSDFHIRYSESDSKAVNVNEIINQFRGQVGIYDKDGTLKEDAARQVEKANAKAIQLYTAGKKKEAILAWKKVLEIDPLNDNARENVRTASAELNANN